MSYRVEKFSSTLKSNLSLIFQYDFDDPDLKFISISRMDVSADLKNVTTYVSALNAEPVILIDKLNNAMHIIKRKLAKKMRLKYIPKIEFKFDTSFEFNQDINLIK